MKVLASLTNRIFLASAALAVITVALAVYLVSASVTRETETALSTDLVESAALVDQQRSALARQYALRRQAGGRPATTEGRDRIPRIRSLSRRSLTTTSAGSSSSRSAAHH